MFNLENMDDDFLDALANDLFSPLIRFDYSPPEIKEVQVKKGDTVVISWKTSEPCRFTLHYEQPESAAPGDITNEELKEYHQVILQDLIPDTVYAVVILVEDRAGNQNTEEITFKTEPVPDSDVPLPLPEKSKIPKTLLVIPVVLVMVAFFILKMRK
ncbi:MAG: fibronectin type III domain-containing protein [Theionarchaea archaeon]|nr:fibronectin type III domain-containing protein [Theionarchaea archaeon]